MRDIVSISSDLQLADAQAPKAGNVLSIQIGELEYAPEFGIDLRFFIDEDFQFQNESFKSYLIQRLSENHVNVAEVLDTFQTFIEKYTFLVGDSDKQTGGFIR